MLYKKLLLSIIALLKNVKRTILDLVVKRCVMELVMAATK